MQKLGHARTHFLHPISQTLATVEVDEGSDPDDFLAELERLIPSLEDLEKNVSRTIVWGIIMDALLTTYDLICKVAILSDRFSFDQLKA